MQAEQLQRVQEELLAIRQSLEPLQKLEREELAKDEPNYTKLDRLERAIAGLDAKELELLRERGRLETQPEGEQRGTAPDTWWQAAHLVLGRVSILRQEDRLAPEIPGSGGGCGGPPAGLGGTSRGRGHARNRAPQGTGCVQ